MTIPETVPDSGATNPALSVGSITAAVTAIIALLVAFGLDISDDQQSAILGVVAVAAPLVTAWVTRGRVYSPATVARLMRTRR